MHIFENIIIKLQLNFPEYYFQTKNEDGKKLIYDIIRKKFVSLTPEEWVRQHVLCFLVQTKKYSAALIAVEREIKYNKLSKRFDVLLFDKYGKPLILIECKAFDVALTTKTLTQIATYNMNFKVPYLFVSNGLKHMLFVLNDKKEYIQTELFPVAE
ncbi:MAG: type I restriction enzyme HsdR N-terminal domain-containing protein [Bacteroidia bacterium]|nr:type I restriction enzyme HsdR N-terminal domain-containing protein [Bacteroidia bacterium]